MTSTLIYTSVCAFDNSKADFEQEIQNIRHVATLKNEFAGITGFLLYFEKRFIQILEGEFDDVTALYSAIRKDERHTNARIVWFSEHDHRQFQNWSMESSMQFITENCTELGVRLKFLNRFVTETPVPHIMLRDLLVSVSLEIQNKKEFPRPRLAA